jgi:flagellar assembly protein FliH
LSDPNTGTESAWRQMDIERLNPCAREPGSPLAGGPEGHDKSFRMLYGPEDPSISPRLFVPLYSTGSDAEDPVAASGLITETGEPDEEQIRQRAHELGLAQGQKDGYAQGMKEAGEVIERMQAILGEMDGFWQHLIGRYETQLVALVCRAAEKVVFSQVADNSDTVRHAILHAFEAIPEPVDVTIEVNPKDAAYIETVKVELFGQIKELKHMTLVPDPSLSPGGCRIKTRSGEIDATLETRLEAITQALMETASNRIAYADRPESELG